ncbi:hypothetical protein BJY01DRAFT_244395 [Aspergillus pseudoustus]|uniref:Ataxin-2 C-terminal domain-containing protein n=1 Tax=Aspergillus pseudoustus TaxID=1810923 RepID=A0ABR4KKL7_9EURO
MAEASKERLNEVQMASVLYLGTARREYISTVDGTRLRNTRVEVIEATRKSNVPGSDEQRLAGANKSRLDGWANMYKKIGDTRDLEGLEPLLNGQSHRLQLNDMIRKMKDPKHVPFGRNIDSSMRGAQHIPGSGSRSVGTVPKQHAGRAVSKATQPVPKSSQSRRSFNPPFARNDGVWRKSFKEQKPAGKTTSSAPNILPLKTRRPIFNGPRAISSPEDFLAAARSMAATKETVNSKTKKPTPRVQWPPVAAKPPSVCQSLHQKTTCGDEGRRPLSNKPQPAGISSSSLSSDPSEEKITPHALADEIEGIHPDISSGSPNPEPSEEHLRASSVDVTGQVDGKPSSTEPQTFVVAEQNAPLITPVPESHGLLLDLTCATPSNFGLEPGLSPALEELKGLEFTQSTEPPVSNIYGLLSANRKLNFGEIANTEVEPFEADNPETCLSLIDEELAAEYRREIDIICKILEQTSLTDTFCSKLTECKVELELRLRLRRAPKSDVEHSRQFSTPKAPVPKGAGISDAATLPEATKPNGEPSSPPTDTTRSQSRLNATAPQFTPQAFTQYRSISNDTSTDSLGSFQPTPSKALRQPKTESVANDEREIAVSQDNHHLPQPCPWSTWTDSTVIASGIPESGHIFGDHLLPGGRRRKPLEIKRTEDAKKPEESHIIGDHLLPGRRTAQTLTMKTGVHLTATSVLTRAAAPKPGFITFSLPVPPKPATPNIASIEKAPKGSLFAPSSPAFSPPTLCLRPNNTPTATGRANGVSKPAPAILESTHAPKLQSQAATVLAAPRKSTNSQGLQGSRYADAKWL